MLAAHNVTVVLGGGLSWIPTVFLSVATLHLVPWRWPTNQRGKNVDTEETSSCLQLVQCISELLDFRHVFSKSSLPSWVCIPRPATLFLWHWQTTWHMTPTDHWPGFTLMYRAAVFVMQCAGSQTETDQMCIQITQITGNTLVTFFKSCMQSLTIYSQIYSKV